MHIRFIGSHWTGKTTLMDLFPEKYIIKEVARSVIKDWKKPQDMDFYEKILFQRKVLERQLEEVKKREEDFKINDLIVSDRSIIDIFVYSRLLKTETQEQQMVKQWLCCDIFKEMKNEKYDLTFYLPIEFDLEDDGIRFTDKDFQKKVDKELLYVLQKLRVPYITLSGSVEERKQKIKDVVKMFDGSRFQFK